MRRVCNKQTLLGCQCKSRSEISTMSQPTESPSEIDAQMPQLSATTLVLPQFWGSKPELWFQMAEAKFNIASPKVTKEETRFYHVLTVLPPEIATEVSDIITKPHPNAPYTHLKEEIIRRTSLSETQKLKQLLSGEELGSRKPAQLLRHMRSLIGEQQYINEKVLRELFFQQMPASIQPILVSLDNLELGEVANVADKILEATPNAAISATRASLNTIGPHTGTTSSAAPQACAVGQSSQHDLNTAILRKIESLEAQIKELGLQHRRHSQQRTRSRSRSNSRHRQTDRKFCWYHNTFGRRARNCVQPCEYSKNDQQERK